MAFVHEVQLRWADLDPLAHVNNVRLMEYFQEARVALLMQMGAIAGEGARDFGQVVARHEVDYLHPLHLTGDPVTVTTEVERIGRASYTLRHEIIDQHGSPAARALTVMVVIDVAGGTSAPIPDAFREALTALMGTPA